MKRTVWVGTCAALMAAAAAAPAFAQKSAVDAIADYRASLQDGNPADLNAARGAALWKQKRGPKNASLEQCDLGKGPGVVAGAAAALPRYFADVDAVMDLESRLVHCMVTLQGFSREEVTARPFSGDGQKATEIEDLVAFLYDESRDATIAVPQAHPKERAAYERGRKMFYYRGGPYDFACATCHSVDGQRIRLQDLPNLTQKAPAQAAFAGWPAYRVSQGALRTMQWRLYDCFRQQRFPELKYLSQASVDLITFLGVNANGGKMAAPAIKR
ncbi:sulfur oxidation c-type cytochrome SoxA [Caldimonas aquatica]|uniref:SoxAX cytochrome complex subunit A n=1 Tax=Caldimonas aquatica TaxID=376175 RepID=A0ABY6MPY5_9BURK|nr:sulfur oxidation c-type cytochrome SoxA [Schlegelella aquatica]UZD53787.1 sulfur oxidation c-type cytochrome SoxA [Schlegelella aquatica]